MVAVIDVWMQHPTARFLRHDMFESLRRWTALPSPDQDPSIEQTIAAMDDAGVERGLLSAWHGPEGPLISNDEVASYVRCSWPATPAASFACHTTDGPIPGAGAEVVGDLLRAMLEPTPAPSGRRRAGRGRRRAPTRAGSPTVSLAATGRQREQA